MSTSSDFSQQVVELVEEVRAGRLDRRDFLRRAALLGLSSTLAGTLLGTVLGRDARAGTPAKASPPSPFARTPSPVRQDVPVQRAGGHYSWGAVQAAEGGPGVSFWLRSPHEGSPRILTKGWPMTAHVQVGIPEVSGSIGSSVRWEGSGTFSSTTGPASTPSFTKAGQNFVKVSVTIRSRVYSSTFWFQAKDANQYARLGSQSSCAADAHGCPGCPHPTIGPVIAGSPDFTIDGKPVARVGDRGIHSACCGPNIFTVKGGDPEIVIDGKQVARLGDPTQHCGGPGKIVRIA